MSAASHDGQRVLVRGPGIEASRAAMIMLHGRNAGPENILELAGLLAHPRVTYLAPAAAGNTWYPLSFMADTERNEPWLSSALAVVKRLVDEVVARGVPLERVLLLGFSQGACLAAEYAIRSAAHLGGVLLLSGGLIGPPGTVWEYPGGFAGTPVFLGCSERDPHIPFSRVEESAAVFSGMRAQVTVRRYPGAAHEVNADELEFAGGLVAKVAGGPA